MGCCIGLLNHRLFLLWLLTISAFFTVACISTWQAFHVCAIHGMLQGVNSLTPHQVDLCIFVGKAGIAAFPCALGFLFSSLVTLFWHIALISSGQTTIEFFRFRLAPWIEGHGWSKPKFDRGLLRNFGEILWPNTSSGFASCEERAKKDQ
jgi:hypothetical protein